MNNGLNEYLSLMSEEEQLQYLNELQNVASAANRHEPELLEDIVENTVYTASLVAHNTGHTVHFDGFSWS